MKALVTGGAGFIGCNLVSRLLARGDDVLIYDNLSRRGAESNLEWLRSLYGPRVRVYVADVRDPFALAGAARDVDVVFHLAAQVAVTTSVVDPRTDFEINALGTFNVLEAARQSPSNPIFIYASTNKVYGGMEDVAVVEQPTRYAYRDLPRGCSRGAAARLPLALRLLEGRGRPVRRATTTASTACGRSSSGSRASTARGSSASRIRAGWRGSPSPR